MKSDGKIATSGFQDRGGAMSTDWEKYARPSETQGRGRVPTENGVVSLSVAGLRLLPQTVEHAPTDANRAHTDVAGDKTAEVRMKLRRLAVWEIPVRPAH